ncbi:uncharacterized protein LOC119327418 isoform X2 [Triticum dicoccoides]|uniref:uncharacterized protein LOC119327418 isoform X2 n=1 Tax=Triticum dicoccoides TaxID=85692 RepID=UPI00189141BC|nr:uncharacterized protein LOC119327418 isoform X2 [Triticum dicoccoides]
MDPAGAGKATAAAAAVCVTGAGGFIASWLVERLLAGGDYAVHGTVHDPGNPKNDHLRTLDGAGEQLRLFNVDVLDYASVASAVAGCAGVFHVASPCPATKSMNPEFTEGVLVFQDAGRTRGLGLRREDRARRGDRVPTAGVRASAAAHGEHQQLVPHQIPEMRRRGRHGRQGEEHGGRQGRRRRPCASVREPRGGRPLHLQRARQEGVRNGFHRQEPASQPELRKQVRSAGGR